MIYINHKKMDAHIIFFDKKLKCHRLNGPAIVDEGYEAWYKNDKYHRIGGPARILGDKLFGFTKEYWIDDEWFNEKDYYDKLKEMGIGI